MLYQIHYQFKDRTEMIAQTEVKEGQSNFTILKNLLDELKVSHPLPDGAQWMFCNEKSEHFAMTIKEKSTNG